MGVIRTIQPRLSRGEAIEAFGGGSLLRRVCHGPLRSVAEFYIPYRLFRIEIREGTRTDHQWLALDSIRGGFDPYRFDTMPAASELVLLETRNHALPTLVEEEARRLILDKVRRVVFGRGLFKLRDLALSAEPSCLEFHIPYWVGVSGRGARAHLSVVDALRGSVEGERVRAFLREWFAMASGPAA